MIYILRQFKKPEYFLDSKKKRSLMDKAFQKEQEIFNSNLNTWLKEKNFGKFVVIKEDQILGIFDDGDAAFTAGGMKYGIGNFFMKKIVPNDSVNVTFMGLVV